MSIADPARTIEVTYHAKQRWVQRVSDEGVSEKNLKAVIDRNDTQITLSILEAYNRSTYLWQGVLFPGAQSAAFSVTDDVIFVTDTNKANIITLYRVELPFPDVLSQEVIKTTVSQIRTLKAKITKHNTKWIPWFQKKREEQKQLETRMRELEAEYKAKLADLKARHDDITHRIWEKEQVTDDLAKQVEEYARIICNSLTFRQEWERNGFR